MISDGWNEARGRAWCGQWGGTVYTERRKPSMAHVQVDNAASTRILWRKSILLPVCLYTISSSHQR